MQKSTENVLKSLKYRSLFEGLERGCQKLNWKLIK